MKITKSILLSTIFLLMSGMNILFGQEDEFEFKIPVPSRESKAYHEYRLKKSVPPYGLDKIKLLISQLDYNVDFQDEGDVDYYSEGYQAISNKVFNKLTLKEKFTYTMIHPEVNTQNCDIQIPILEENKKIFGYLADGFDEVFWSNRQINFLKNNKDSIIVLIKESTLRSKRMGFNYKMVLSEINLVESIPFLIDLYNKDKKDGDLLTLLMLLMKNNNYQPFLKSQSYQKLYGDNSYYESYIDYNKANEELIKKRATDFYKQYNKQ